MTTPASSLRPGIDPPRRRHRRNAAATPEKEQPFAALGLKPDEYAQIREILGRRPTSGELAMYSVMWTSTAPTSRARSTSASSARRSQTR